ncbi:hypothetical protein GCM10023321_66230 [Pseudonocardia eucalypti]|uniref:PPE family protein n=1 Tax=Pseudonocardia eucalypti TaxID=648755 RepID=A0ABP9R0A2_9PSEU|nr:hypothetical protein [Pseudonocardia eucalypti]
MPGEFTDYRWEGFQLAEKYRWVHQQPGAGAVRVGTQILERLAGMYGESETTLGKGLGQLRVDWLGGAADSASGALTNLASWTKHGQLSGQTGGGRVDRYGRSFDQMAPKIPPPVDVGENSFWGSTLDGAVDAINWGASDAAKAASPQSDYRKRLLEEARRDKIANDALYAHQASTVAEVAGFPRTAPPPTVLASVGERGPEPGPTPGSPGTQSAQNSPGSPTGGGPASPGGPPASSGSPPSGVPTVPPAGPPPRQSGPRTNGTGTNNPRPNGSGRPNGPGGPNVPGRPSPPGGPSIPPVPGTGPHRSTAPSGPKNPFKPGDLGVPGRPPGGPGAFDDPQLPRGRGVAEPTPAGGAGTPPGTGPGRGGPPVGAGGMPMAGMSGGGGKPEEREHRNNVFLPSDEPFLVEFEDEVPPVIGVRDGEPWGGR